MPSFLLDPVAVPAGATGVVRRSPALPPNHCWENRKDEGREQDIQLHKHNFAQAGVDHEWQSCQGTNNSCHRHRAQQLADRTRLQQRSSTTTSSPPCRRPAAALHNF
jgi:hypothetical protein